MTKGRSRAGMAFGALAALAIAGSALAGGAASVKVQTPPSEPVAGEPTQLEFRLLQHDVRPISWEGVTVIARNGDEEVTATATPRGEPGDYVAEITFPTTGDWRLDFRLDTLVYMRDESVVPVLTVGAPVAAPAAEPGMAATARAPGIDPILVLALLGIAFLGTVFALSFRSARPGSGQLTTR